MHGRSETMLTSAELAARPDFRLGDSFGESVGAHDQRSGRERHDRAPRHASARRPRRCRGHGRDARHTAPALLGRSLCRRRQPQSRDRRRAASRLPNGAGQLRDRDDPAHGVSADRKHAGGGGWKRAIAHRTRTRERLPETRPTEPAAGCWAGQSLAGLGSLGMWSAFRPQADPRSAAV